MYTFKIQFFYSRKETLIFDYVKKYILWHEFQVIHIQTYKKKKLTKDNKLLQFILITRR